MPVSVRAIGGRALGECPLTGGIVCGAGCCFRAIDGLVLSDDCTICFSSYGVLSSVCVPDSVRELCDGCFKGCESLYRVTFGPASSLERVGAEVFGEVSDHFDNTGWACWELHKISIPDSVRELADCCFKGCRATVTFGPSLSLERIGFDALTGKRLRMREEYKTSYCQIPEEESLGSLGHGALGV